MKFGALALDWDGTIAEDGRLDNEVRAAIAEARARGVVTMVVTGRRIADLRSYAGDLAFVDGVVAENGAVLSFPSGLSRLLGRPPPAGFLHQLRKAGIDFTVGECVVEVEGRLAPQVLAIVRELELPLALCFNRSRLMVLPRAVCKATGLREALAVYRLSPHNAIAIGDAENDHDLLEACELGAAVEWGSDALKEAADEIVHGSGPSAVAAYIRRAVQRVRLPPDRRERRVVRLGQTRDGRTVSLAIRGRNLLVAGAPRSGKSWVTGLACEQLILYGYSVCVIDPEGDYSGLVALPGVAVFGGKAPLLQPRDLVQVLRHPDMSVVVDLSQLRHQEKIAYLASLLPALGQLRRRIGLPHRIVVDEAHYFLGGPEVRRLLDLELAAYTLVTYHVSQLNPELRAAVEAVLVTRMSDPREVRALMNLFGASADSHAAWSTALADLAIDEAALLAKGHDSQPELLRFQIAPRLTTHVRHKVKYRDSPVADAKAFVFTQDGKPTGARAQTLNEFVSALADSPLKSLDGHARRNDFSSWVADVLGDDPLAHSVRRLENAYRLGRLVDIRKALVRVIGERYGVVSTSREAP